jgi:hypothetical protein
MSALWDGLEALGPFYHLPVVIPLAVFAGIALDQVLARQRALAIGTVVAMLALTLVAVRPAVDRNRDETDDYESIDAVIDAAGLDHAVLFVDYTPDTGFEARTPFLRNRPDLDQPVLYAYDRGGADFALVDRYPDRSLARLESVLRSDSPSGFNLGAFLLPDRHPFRSDLVVTPIEIERGPDFEQPLGIRNPEPGASMTFYRVVPGAAIDELELGAKRRAGVVGTVDAEELDGAEPAGELRFGVRVTPRDGAPARAYELRYPYRLTADGEIEVMTPGTQWAQHGDTWYRQDISDVLRTG